MFRSAIFLLVTVFPIWASEPVPYDQPGIPPREVLAKMNAEQLFGSLCAVCHKKDLSGGFGPSFLDGKWKHGSSDTAIIRTIKEGNLDLGMLPWKGILTDRQIRSLVAYIRQKEHEALGKSGGAKKPGPGKVKSIKKNGDSSQCTIQTDSDIVLRVVFYRSDVFRILAAPDGDFADPGNNPEEAQILVPQPPCSADIKINDGESKVTFTTDVLSLTLDKADCRFALARADGKLLWRETHPLDIAEEKTVQVLSTDKSEQFFGGCPQNGYFTHKGTKIEIRAPGNWNEGGHPNPAPFYLSSHGYGVLRKTFAPGAYDFTSNLQITLEHDERRFDACYFVGDTFKQVLNLYTRFTSRPNFVPLWALKLGEADAYMCKCAKEAWDTGAPIVRGMVWEFPDDPVTYDPTTEHQFMLGKSLLFAPVYTSLEVNKGWRHEGIYLPKGQWIDYWDGRRIEGPTVIDNYPVTLEKLPILVRAGAVIPMYPKMLYNNQKPKDPLTFDVYPYGKSKFTLYEDDGLTRKFELGESATQRIRVEAPEGEAGDIAIHLGPSAGAFDGKLATRVYEFLVHTELEPVSVKVDGKTLPKLANPDAYSGDRAAWYFNPAERRGIAHIKLSRRPTDKPVDVRIDIDESQKIPASPAYPVPEVAPD